MLRTVVTKNFVHFYDFTKLDLHCGANVIIGPNASGKSSFFETVRRCMSNTINHSLSPITNSSKTAFTICKYDLGKHPYKEEQEENSLDEHTLLAGVVHDKGSYYKICQVLKSSDHSLVESYIDLYSIGDVMETSSRPFNQSVLLETNQSDEYGNGVKEGLFNLLACDESERNNEIVTKLVECLQKKSVTSTEQEPSVAMHDATSTDISDGSSSLQTSTDRSPQDISSNETPLKERFSLGEAIMQYVTDKYFVATFGLRDISTMHWTKSVHMARNCRDQNYESSSLSAEILNALLSDTENIDTELEKRIFETLVYPSVYIFKKDGVKLTIDDGTYESDLVKIPSGVLEAKQFSLMVAHKQFRTLCLEEPSRSMHPQMIGRMIEILTWFSQQFPGKVILLQSHNQAMLNMWTFDRTFVFRRPCGGAVSVTKPDMGEKHFSRDDVLRIPFASHVLITEGALDKNFIKRLIQHLVKDDTRIKEILQQRDDKTENVLVHNKAKEAKRVSTVQEAMQLGDKKDEIDKFKTFLGSIHVMELGGAGEYEKLKQFTESIKIEADTFYIFDKDKFFDAIPISTDDIDKHSHNDIMMSQICGASEEDLKELRRSLVRQYKISSKTKNAFSGMLSAGDNTKAVDSKLEKKNIFSWRNGNLEETVRCSILTDLTRLKSEYRACYMHCENENIDEFQKFVYESLKARKIKEKRDGLKTNDIDMLAKFILGGSEGKRLFCFLKLKFEGLNRTGSKKRKRHD